MAAALVDFLPDFGRGKPAAPPAAELLVDRTVAPEPAPPVPDVGALIAEAVAQAEAAQAQRLAERHEAAVAALQAAHAAEIGALTARLGAETGAAVAAAMSAVENRLVETATATTARLVAPLLSEAAAQRAVAELARHLRDTVGDAADMRIVVHGPEALFAAFAVAMGAWATRLECVAADGFDLTVSVGDTLFETRLSDWSAALAAIVAGDRA